MKIKVYFESGRIIEHNTLDLCSSEPFKSIGNNITTEFDLRTDLLKTHGLFLIIYWNDCKISDDNTQKYYDEENCIELPYTSRQKGVVVQMISLRELESVIKIVVDGEMIIWRQDNEFVNGTKFANQELLCYSNISTSSINKRAIKIFTYLKNANSNLSNEDIADLLGYPIAAIEKIIEDEAANTFHDDEFE